MPDKREDLENIEQYLRQVAPKSLPVNRESVFFQAGKTSMRGPMIRATIVACCLGLVSGLAIATPLAQWLIKPQERIVYVPVVQKELSDNQQQNPKTLPSKNDNSAEEENRARQNDIPSPGRMLNSFLLSWERPQGSYLHLRDQVIRWGPEILPQTTMSSEAAESPKSIGDMYSDYLDGANPF